MNAKGQVVQGKSNHKEHNPYIKKKQPTFGLGSSHYQLGIIVFNVQLINISSMNAKGEVVPGKSNHKEHNPYNKKKQPTFGFGSSPLRSTTLSTRKILQTSKEQEKLLTPSIQNRFLAKECKFNILITSSMNERGRGGGVVG